MLYAMATDVDLPPFVLPPPEAPEHLSPLPMPLGSSVPLDATRQVALGDRSLGDLLDSQALTLTPSPPLTLTLTPSMALGDLLESQAAPSTGWRPHPRSQP